MKKYGVIVLIVLIVAALVAPGAVGAKEKPAMTNGSATVVVPTWYGGPSVGSDGPYTLRYVWLAIAGDGVKPAKGSLTLTVSHVLADGTVEVVATQGGPVVAVTRVSSTTVDFSIDGKVAPPGDPAHGDSLFRALDNGKTGDDLLQHCSICSFPPPLEVFHAMSTFGATPQVRVR